MKTRIIKTVFWQKMVQIKAPLEARYLYSYLLTSSFINMSGIFEIADDYLLMETALTKKQLHTAKQWLHTNKKVFFYGSWIYVLNALEHNGYHVGPKNITSYEKELKNIPKNVKDYFDNLKDSTIGGVSTLPDSPPIVTINHKSEIKNNNQEESIGESVREGKREGLGDHDSDDNPNGETVSDNKVSDPLDILLTEFNLIYGTKYSSKEPLRSNFLYWSKSYSIDQMKEAIKSAHRNSEFWKKALTPEKLLRRKGTNGEDCNRIEEFLNLRSNEPIRNFDRLEATARKTGLLHD